MSQIITTVKVAIGATVSDIQSISGMRLVGIGIPAGSSLNGKTLSLVNMFGGQRFVVSDTDGTPFSATLTAETHLTIPEEIGDSLSEFRLEFNSAVSGSDATVLLFGAMDR